MKVAPRGSRPLPLPVTGPLFFSLSREQISHLLTLSTVYVLALIGLSLLLLTQGITGVPPLAAVLIVVLLDVGRQIAMMLRDAHVQAELERARGALERTSEHLVALREEERRRLCRDLHDGLGPQLASLTLKLETARNRLAYDPLAVALLSDLASRTEVTTADIRHLVYALRPPALDERGLISALHELALQYSEQICVQFDTPAYLPELSAAVQVAVYRIAQEALTNVVRHAHAHHCQLRLTLNDSRGWLVLTVEDDGCGLPTSRGVGVGLVSMRERAEELGGTCTIQRGPRGGTQVLVRLPGHFEPVDPLATVSTALPEGNTSNECNIL